MDVEGANAPDYNTAGRLEHVGGSGVEVWELEPMRGGGGGD